MERQKYSSGSPWEPVVGYSRAVKVGNTIYVAGTTGTNSAGETEFPNDAYHQARYALEKIGFALEALGATFKDVVRTRTFITRECDWEDAGRAHGEFFADIRPASTMVLVSGLIKPGLVVEIEVEAVID